MNVLKRIGNIGVVPVVVIDDAEKAVPAAKALLAGGVDVMEITLRTKAGLDAIRAVAHECTDMLVGAGTVITLEQCKQAVEAGAKFIVSPGFSGELVEWCIENGVAVTPGCVTPTEITSALALGLKVLKFFPANVYGGLEGMKALSAPFGDVKFIPTGGVNGQNVAEYASAPFVHAVGGSWLCAKADIAAANFERITALCRDTLDKLLGFELAHIGINSENEAASLAVAQSFTDVFGFGLKAGGSSNFAGPYIEVMKSRYLGENGHIAIRTNSIARAIYALAKKGYKVDMDTAKYSGDKMAAVYLTGSFGGFAVHLLQK